MVFLGVDPGVSGGLAFVRDDGHVIGVHKMPENERELLDLLKMHVRGDTGVSVRAVLERVHSSPQMGKASVFTFGKGYGALRMGLVAAGIPFDEPTPQSWQKALSCRTQGDKAVSKARAHELFPTAHVTNWSAEALLLAEYCRRVQLGIAPPPPPVDPVAPRLGRSGLKRTMTGKGDAF
jgi:hypothetical protein